MMITICNLLWRGDRQRLVCDEMILWPHRSISVARDSKGERLCRIVAEEKKAHVTWGDDRVDGGLKSSWSLAIQRRAECII